MLVLKSKVIIRGDKTWEFTEVNSCNITKDIASLTDTCKISIPKNIKWQEYYSKEGKPPVKRGDQVEVWLGYHPNLEKRFSGYIKEVDAKVPVQINCEDGMFLLKTLKVEKKAFKDAYLHDVVTHILKDSNVKFKIIDNIKIGYWRVSFASASGELQEIKEKIHLDTYFREIEGENVLYVGLKYPLDNIREHYFERAKNIISEDFTYKNADDIKVEVEAETIDAKGVKKTVRVGESGGEIIKVRIDGLSDAELREYANEIIHRKKQDGLSGSLTTFGMPSVDKCDVVNIKPYQGRNGSYLVSKNEISFGMEGYRQKIYLREKIS